MKSKEKASLLSKGFQLSAFSFLLSKGFLLSAFSFLLSKGFLLSAFCFLLSISVMAAATSTQPTDTTGDGKVTTADAELIYSYILGTADGGVTPEQVDVNGDGTVNTLDVVAVYVAMNTPEEPKPEEPDGFDGQGTDTNNDYDFGGRGK